MIAEITCQICAISPSKYSCPKCGVKSCCLACSKKHKETLACDGKREKNNFIKRKEMNLNTVFSDSSFLQEIKSAVAVGTVAWEGNAGQEKYHHHQGAINNLKQIVRHASSNNCTVKLAPAGLKRARTNQSKYIKKRKEISWTIEWRFQIEDKYNEQQADEEDGFITVLNHRYSNAVSLSSTKTLYSHPTYSEILKRSFWVISWKRQFLRASIHLPSLCTSRIPFTPRYESHFERIDYLDMF